MIFYSYLCEKEDYIMKEIKDRFVRSNAWYFVIGYLNDTHYEPILRRHLERYDENNKDMYGHPTWSYHMEWMDFELFKEIFQEALAYYTSTAEEMTDENIKKYFEH